jgi:drug/metabolite transporter (DMT)-like permease
MTAGSRPPSASHDLPCRLNWIDRLHARVHEPDVHAVALNRSLVVYFHLLALVGVVSISFSAIFVRLASVSPVTATLFRALYAVPALLAVWMPQRAKDVRSGRERAVAVVSGLVLALDLTLWHESIALVGAGLGTVIANVQVVFVAAAAWLLYGERPKPGVLVIVAAVAGGVALTSGLSRHDAYGTNPALGAVLGVLAGLTYAAFLLLFRSATRSLAPTSGPLLDSTIGTIAGALAFAAFDPGFSLVPTWPAHGWLVLLALVSQVIGWLLIATALPRLPAIETSVLLLGQPVLAVLWGVLWFAERLSPVQWAGSALVLAGVAAMSTTTD